jgi:hypothetical protein
MRQDANLIGVLIRHDIDGLNLRWSCAKYMASGSNKRLPKRRVSQ